MGIDAVALLRVKSKRLLRERLLQAHLPPACIDPLDDGSALFSSFARFATSGPGAYELRVLLTCVFGDDLAKIHDDPRGVLLFPDVCEPKGRTYEDLVRQTEGAGVWLPIAPLSEDELQAHATRQMAQVQEILAGVKSPPLVVVATEATAPFEAAATELGLGSFAELVSQVTARLGSLDLSAACLLLQRTVPNGDPFLDAEGTHALADGTRIIVTGSLLSDKDMIALSLGEQWAPWLSAHRDGRGVMVFSEACLDAVRACKDYESAVSRAEEKGSWITPTTMDDVIAKRAARSVAFLEEE